MKDPKPTDTRGPKRGLEREGPVDLEEGANPMPPLDGETAAPLGYRLATWTLSKTPHGVMAGAARLAGLLFYALSRTKRTGYLANTTPAVRFGRRCPPWRAFQNHALNVLEVLKATTESEAALSERITVHGYEHIDEALRRGRGLILTTFHWGNWELAGLILAVKGCPITTIAGEQFRRGWSEQIKALKKRFGIRMVGPGEGLRGLYRDLRSNRAVVLHIDGDIFARGYEVDFLGRRVTVPRGPAHLSRVLSSPVALAYCRRNRENRLHVHIHHPAPPPSNPCEEAQLTQALMSHIENCVLDDPGQWCIFRALSKIAEQPIEQSKP